MKTYRVKIEEIKDKGYYELLAIGTSEDIEIAFQLALEKMEEIEQEKEEI